MSSTADYRFEQKIQRERRQAQRTAPFRDARNDAARCPWIYGGFEEVPRFPKSAGSSIDAGSLEIRLRAIDARQITIRRETPNA